MSGQTPQATYEQDSSDISSVLEIDIDTENLDIVDPLADFIEKHGYKLVRNHDGEYVTVAEAIENCPPFKRLVLAMGESALALMATQKPEKENSLDENETELEKTEAVDAVGKENQAERQQEIITAETEISNHQKREEKGALSADIVIADKEQSSVGGAESVGETNYHEEVSSGLTPINGKTPIQTAKADKPVPQVTENKTQPSPPKLAEASDQSISEAVTPVSRVKPVHPTPPVTASNQPKAIKIISKSTMPDIAPAELIYIATKPESKPQFATQKETVPMIEAENSVKRKMTDSTPEARYFEEREMNDLLEDPEVLPNITNNEIYSMPTPETVSPETPPIKNEFMESPEESTETIIDSPVAWAEDEEVDIVADTFVPDFSQSEVEQHILRVGERDMTETAYGLSVPLEEIESTGVELMEKIEELKPEDRFDAHEMLDNIVLQAELAKDVADDFEIENIEEDLKELFTRLFDRIGIEHSPEIPKSYAMLALKEDISKIISDIELENKQESLIDEGTHEAITKLLAAVASIKKAVRYSYRIGKSTLRLYAQQLASA